ncbi:hypothetical protein BU24DRAFT_455199 [Aaosphaeria arxii CBS 175.79]|uniref:Uncharacterized protein n=1 Tax=Aaosphaeria arxii CBS 175.79 TaxID=1450172 RepID=A0A6A5XAP8_9PLEO|nr:uncharacterized protein BU24DRAFT_455199 [Aaosphaeria arxii CBS 175.79]KAF2010032.1 hypothetical protein BU24DRAFT_455199 [Aaosphaeria arxii CBS 175.79]
MSDEEYDSEDFDREDDDSEPDYEFRRRNQSPEVVAAPNLRSFKSQLRGCLDRIEHEGTFSAIHHYQSYTPPGLFLDALGSVGLPLSIRDAEAIKQACLSSNSGPLPMDDIWEVGFECKNPEWEAQLDTYINRTVELLGFARSIWAVPRRTLLCGVNAFANGELPDNTETRGKCGTLLICLPSEHTGGNIEVSHHDERCNFATSATSAFGLTVLAWHSDVSSKVQRITSGYRLALEYDLVRNVSEGPEQTATSLSTRHNELQQILQQWQDAPNFPDILLYPLKRKYTDLALQSLQGGDAAKARYLDHVCKSNGFLWFLGRLTRTETVIDEEPDIPMKHSLHQVVTPLGEAVELSRIIDISHIVTEDLYRGRQSDNEVGSDFEYDMPRKLTIQHHDNVVLVLVDRAKLLQKERILDCTNSASLLSYFKICNNELVPLELRESLMQTFLQAAIEMLFKALKGVLSVMDHNGLVHEDRAISEMKQVIVGSIKHSALVGRSEAICSILAPALRNPVFWASLSNPLAKVIKEQIYIDFVKRGAGVFDAWFSYLPDVRTFVDVNNIRTFLDQVAQQIPTTSSVSHQEFRERKLTDLLRNIQDYSESDVNAILSLIDSRAVPPRVYYDVVIPTLARGNRAALSLFLERFGCKSVDEHWRPTVQATFKSLLETSMTTLKARHADLKDQNVHVTGNTTISSRTYVTRLIEILRTTLHLKLQSEARLLMEVAFSDVPDLKSPIWSDWTTIFDIQKGLFHVMEQYDYEPLNMAAAYYSRTSFANCVESLALKRPRPPVDWSRGQVYPCSGSCLQCRDLNHFLGDPVQPQAIFGYPMQARKHIEFKLNGQYCECVTDKDFKPHRFIVTKTDGRYRELQTRWITEVDRLRERLTSLVNPFGLKVLGASYVQALFDRLDNASISQPGPTMEQEAQSNPHGQLSGPLQPPASVSGPQGYHSPLPGPSNIPVHTAASSSSHAGVKRRFDGTH